MIVTRKRRETERGNQKCPSLSKERRLLGVTHHSSSVTCAVQKRGSKEQVVSAVTGKLLERTSRRERIQYQQVWIVLSFGWLSSVFFNKKETGKKTSFCILREAS